MRVSFVIPHYGNSAKPVIEMSMPPLNLVNCATILQKNGFAVEVIDAAISKMTAEEVASRLSGSDVVAVMSSSLLKWHCPPLDIPHYYTLVEKLKNIKQPPFIIALGPHSLFNAEGLARVVDLVVLGQAEPFFEKLTPIMKTEEYFSLEGIAFLQDDRVIRRGKPLRYDLKRLPQPNLKLLPYLNYRSVILDGPMMLVETSRGCPEDCSFCFRGMTDYTFSSKTGAQVVNELKYLHDELGIHRVFFTDLAIGVAKEVFKTWMREIVKQKLTFRWACNVRISTLEDEALVELMGKAGCEVVCVGIESAKKKAFEDFKKTKNETTVIRTIQLLKKHDIKVMGFFLLGSIYDENEKDIEDTIQFAKRICLDYAAFYIAIPYPTTRFYRQIGRQHGILSSENIPFCYSKNLTHRQLTRLRKKAYLSFYLSPRYIRSNLSQLFKPRDYVRNLRVFLNLIRMWG